MIAVRRPDNHFFRKMSRATLLAGSMAVGMAAPATATDHAVIDIHASGFVGTRGHAVAKLFRPGDNVLGRGRWQTAAVIENGKAVLQFRDLPKGPYAIVVFHDENDNDTIDHGALGIPKEALGFSNGFALGLTSGLPNFEKLRFDYGGGLQRLDIEVR